MCRYVLHRYVSKCAGTGKVPHKGKETDLVIEPTRLNVLGKGEWKVRKPGPEKRRIRYKLQLTVDPAAHNIVAARALSGHSADVRVIDKLNTLTLSVRTKE